MPIAVRRIGALLLLLSTAAAPFDSHALSCGYYPDSVRQADDVYIIGPRQVLSRDVVLEKYSRIAGMPGTYDLVRFEVLETLRGPRLSELELYCGSGCGDDRQRKWSVFAVAKQREDGQPNLMMACNVGDADDNADADTKQALDDVRHGIRERPHR